MIVRSKSIEVELWGSRSGARQGSAQLEPSIPPAAAPLWFQALGWPCLRERKWMKLITGEQEGILGSFKDKLIAKDSQEPADVYRPPTSTK